MKKVNSANMITDKIRRNAIEKVYDNELEYSESFAAKEPKATIDIIEQIEKGFLSSIADRQISESERDNLWKIFLLGYEVGKQTHAFNVDVL